MNKLEFVNHSCVIISNENISLAMDPWVEGSVFNNSWNLLVKTPANLLENLKKSNYIWFSHEHPDHFNPPNLKIFNKDTNFIFQKTKDKRVVRFLSKISSNIKELDYKEEFFLDKSFTIQTIPFQYLDSMCLIKLNGINILNLNDCDIKNEKQLRIIKKLCGPLDLLMVQFSYAIGKSNKENINERKIWSSTILNKLSHTINFLKPKNVIPFASYCFFSRHDNFYLNDCINKIGPTIEFLKTKNPSVNFLCLYPGDVWDFKSKWHNDTSIDKYSYHYDQISPIQINNRRCLETAMIGEVRIPKGTPVHMIIAGANRDPLQFFEPEIFDISRSPNRHLSFGLGIHICAGINLARLEAKVAFLSLMSSFKEINLSQKPKIANRIRFREIKEMKVEVSSL